MTKKTTTRCMVCGCTELAACSEHCAWTDGTCTLCTSCIGRAPWISIGDVVNAAVQAETMSEVENDLKTGNLPPIVEWPQDYRRRFVADSWRSIGVAVP